MMTAKVNGGFNWVYCRWVVMVNDGFVLVAVLIRI
jgi:hypothetical protein